MLLRVYEYISSILNSSRAIIIASNDFGDVNNRIVSMHSSFRSNYSVLLTNRILKFCILFLDIFKKKRFFNFFLEIISYFLES